MPGSIEEHRAKLRAIAKQFDTRLRLARASELASLGRFLEAEELLCPDMRIPGSAEELDLLARIHVRQGNVEKARKYWQDAAEMSKERAHYEECIQVLDDWAKDRQRRAAPGCRVRLCILLLTAGLTVWVLVRNFSTAPI